MPSDPTNETMRTKRIVRDCPCRRPSLLPGPLQLSHHSHHHAMWAIWLGRSCGGWRPFFLWKMPQQFPSWTKAQNYFRMRLTKGQIAGTVSSNDEVDDRRRYHLLQVSSYVQKAERRGQGV